MNGDVKPDQVNTERSDRATNANNLTCSQCGKSAVTGVNNAPLCVDCYHKLEVARTLAFRLEAIALNHAIAQMDHVVPIGRSSPKMQVPEAPGGMLILNNIKVDNSVVGTINTGNVEAIDVNITCLRNAGSDSVSNALRQITEAVANDATIARGTKDQLLDQVAFLSEQAVASAKDRRPGMISAAFTGITQASTAVSGIAAAWNSVKPLLQQFFGIG